jgi:hypothetical protein
MLCYHHRVNIDTYNAMININIEDLIQVVYEVYTVTHSGDTGMLAGVYRTYQEAYEGAKEKGNWGTSGKIVSAKGIVVGDDVFVLKHNEEPMIKLNVDIHRAKIKELLEVFDKLTEEDIKRLGINKEQILKEKNPIESPLNKLI